MGVGGSRAVTSWAVTCSRVQPHLQTGTAACYVQYLPHKIEAAAHNHAESFCQYQLQDFSLIELYSKFTLSTDSKNHDLYCPWIDWLMMHWFLQKQVFILMLSWVYEFPRVYCENADSDSVRMKFTFRRSSQVKMLLLISRPSLWLNRMKCALVLLLVMMSKMSSKCFEMWVRQLVLMRKHIPT